ncbi:hypothetical protein M0Q28_06070 [Patescibacteria group bacterium]|jgi:hypothetical protein|nr:hypothetical protein [Patescibacteria group bacterium]
MVENRDLIFWLYEALGQPIGLLLHSDDPFRLVERLRSIRAKQEDEQLAILQFRVVDFPEGNVAICKIAGTAAADADAADLGL